MSDPRHVFEDKDMAGAVLYAKQLNSDAADAWPILADASGYLLVNMTVGTVTLSSTASTITNAVGNPVNVSLTSTAVTVAGTVSLTTTAVTASLSSTAVTISMISGQAAVAGGVGATGASVQRVVLANDQGRTLSSSSGTLAATQVTLVLAGSNKTKVYAFSLTTTSTTGVICSFMHGSQSGPELWRVLLQAPSGANSGANLAVTPPGYLFATPSSGNLILFLSAAVRVDFSLAYYDEA